MSNSSNLLNDKEIFRQYEDFLIRVNELISVLTPTHSSRMICSAGCSSCCRHLTLLPIEWHYLKYKIASLNSMVSMAQTDEDCPFLENDNCRIYEYRPLICRTHGLPLLYLTDDFQWQLSFCPLNFTMVGEDDFEDIFTPENCLNMEELNSELSYHNSSFIKKKAGEKFSPASRISMKSLFS